MVSGAAGLVDGTVAGVGTRAGRADATATGRVAGRVSVPLVAGPAAAQTTMSIPAAMQIHLAIWSCLSLNIWFPLAGMTQSDALRAGRRAIARVARIAKRP